MKRWYVVQIYAGYEEAIKTDLERRIKETGKQDVFGEVLIPSAKVKSMFSTEAKDEQQLFPGYLLVEMELSQETMRLVQATPRVIRFLGGKEPMPLSQKEIGRIVSQMKGEVALVPKKSDFVVGSEVDISEGPFAGFVGVVEKVDEANERLTLMVSIFGRMTPIELGFDQVKR
ncbi:MAG TPA: transcription termination/antitermination protein NusG [Candidatus Babeliales bacterium]|nr:transcription termination/antitermination protein NusG [Candidatus Babeliales bacterium]